jgi:hypothetical protein
MRLNFKHTILVMSAMLPCALGVYFWSNSGNAANSNVANSSTALPTPVVSALAPQASSPALAQPSSPTPVQPSSAIDILNDRRAFDAPNAYDDDPVAFAGPEYLGAKEANMEGLRSKVKHLNEQYAKGALSQEQFSQQVKSLILNEVKQQNSLALKP